MTTTETRTRPQVAIMNAVHDLPVLVARDKGYFKDEGLDIEFVTTPGMAQVTTSHSVKFDSVFDRPLDSVYNDGGIDQYRMCEWGIMKRAVEAECSGLRRRRIVALGASMSKFAIAVAPGLQDLRARDAQGQGHRRDAEQRLALHHAQDDGRIPEAGAREDDHGGVDAQAHRGVEAGQGRRGEPDGALDQRGAEDGPAHPHRIALHPQRGGERRSRRPGRSRRCFAPRRRAVKDIEKDPTPYVHYFIRETGGLLEPHEFQTWRLLHAAPQPYTRERWDDTYNWSVRWNMTVPGATYENIVDNRAWQ